MNILGFIIILLILLLTSINYSFAVCGHNLPEVQLRQRSSVNISEETKAIKNLATISKRKAKKIAISQYPGKVKKAELITEEGTLVWKLEVKGSEGQKEIFIDPANGTFLGYGLTK